jgi:AMIN domain
MRRFPRAGLSLLLLLGISMPAWAQAKSAVRRVQVLGSKNAVEIEVEGSATLVPQTRVLTGPDRLVIDFPNTTPGDKLRPQAINRGEVKDVRVGLFQANPPVTRLVLDLNSPQSFQIFPDGHNVIIKVTGAAPPPVSAGVEDFPAPQPELVNASFHPAGDNATAAAPQAIGTPGLPALQVTFQNGLLSIRANKASLSELLFAVHQRTGAEVAIAAGAEQEQVVADIGPAPAPEVLAHLLNGSKFNFLILSAPNNPRILERVILTAQGMSANMPLAPMPSSVPASPVVDDDPAPQPEPIADNAPRNGQPPPPGQPGNQPQPQVQPEDPQD